MTGRACRHRSGPCGLGQLRAFQQAESKSGAEIPRDRLLLEKQSDWGVLVELTLGRSGTDEYGELVHSSMYRWFAVERTEVEALEFADYTLRSPFQAADTVLPAARGALSRPHQHRRAGGCRRRPGSAQQRPCAPQSPTTRIQANSR